MDAFTTFDGSDDLVLVAEDIDAEALDDLTAAGFTCAGSFACAGSASCPASSASSGSSFSSAGG
ncbi:thiocillin family RiPP [Dermatophilaceae bacterium Soc4.6]